LLGKYEGFGLDRQTSGRGGRTDRAERLNIAPVGRTQLETAAPGRSRG
jgi:hypothetical protein